ncbi:hypothetical protein [Burkholderia cenocepacia]|uniref:hypothetical protein n=1 Tax=Burkholderia cenocepacia TaxID=95486 RepID=UPI0028B84236|nr:hypothetical protein [Burkholderia cenocepacia]MDT6992073.1 hypothetical protein [Burkholderia cenocepacia]
MSEDSILEAELQEWFEAAAAASCRTHFGSLDEAIEASRTRTIYDCIENRKDLDDWLERLRRARRVVDRTSQDGLAKARLICSALADADHLSGNNSVAPPRCRQMRPDVVLTSDSGHYILVELKTKKASERQGVQELLAYSAAIKEQAPYVNDFMYVIVANHWDDLLKYGIRSLIMDGKHVLPLQFTRRGPKDFALSIRLDLFEFSFVQYFDVERAMVPAVLAVGRATNLSAPFGPVEKYLCGVAHQAANDCERLNQTGFAFTWTSTLEQWKSELSNLTLVTVNQYWHTSEHLPSHYPRPDLSEEKGFHGLLYRKAEARKTAVAPSNPADEEDIFAAAFASSEADRVYAQSSLSYELLERYRDRDVEDGLRKKVPRVGLFESGESGNLKLFMMSSPADMRIGLFRAFGELKDFMRETPRHHLAPLDYTELDELIQDFREYKNSQPGAFAD